MTTQVAPEVVGSKVVEWYSCIVARDTEQAVRLKEETNRLVQFMDADDKVLAFYSLVEFRHDLFMEIVKKEQTEDLFQELSEGSMDHTLRFLYYLMSGRNEFFHERYRAAIKSYRKAERLLEHIDDEAEEAEFYFLAGSAYYRLNQYPLAASYMEQALILFRRLGYLEKVLNCKIILSSIDTELLRFDAAETTLQELIIQSEPYPQTRAMVFRIVGLNRLKQGDFQEAERFFRQALQDQEMHANLPVGMKTKFNLANVLFRQGQTEEANALFKGAEAGAATTRILNTKLVVWQRKVYTLVRIFET
ncbi:tetratricopeptide repeat protein [Bacillus sp. JCM 19041]|uniref:response regulator aspartate phosphatase n=1 Tax=Bacillus sp. JCM 19041 TaxID=1460637 RepID=UPI0006D02636